MPGTAKRPGHRIRQLSDAQPVQTATNDYRNPLAPQKSSDHLDMDSDRLLRRAFGGFHTTGSSSIQPGTWAADLAFLVSDDVSATTYLESADLDTINKRFSISTYLSSAGVNQVAPNVILHKGQPIDGALLACLALNDECRKKGNAVFYHLPLREKIEVGHAADLVFVLKSWTRKAKYDWDNAGWLERLAMYGVDENCYNKIDSSALVIPICSRILRFNEPNTKHPHTTAADAYDEKSGRPLPNYSSDPAVVENVYRYSRPLQDLSSYVVIYPSIHTPPLTCATGIFEDKAHCDRHPTPNDMSETFMLRVNCHDNATQAELHGKVAKAMAEYSRKRYLAAGNPMSSNADVVACLLRAWNDEARMLRTLERTENGDKVRYSWQELINVLDLGLQMRALVATWPRN